MNTRSLKVARAIGVPLEEASALTGLTPDALRMRVKRGRLAWTKVGKYLVLDRQEVAGLRPVWRRGNEVLGRVG